MSFLLFIAGLMIGIVSGYGLRSAVSHHRRKRAEARRMLYGSYSEISRSASP
jgi:hypothetical protein